LLAGAWDEWSADLDAHLDRHGPLPVPPGPRSAGRLSPLIELVERSGLTGRGGAGFPTGRKLRSVATRKGPAIVVANGMEGEPASAKDRLLLTRLPHLVLDGVSLAAEAVGADSAYLAIHRGDHEYAAHLRRAISLRAKAGVDEVPIELAELPRRYVASEQSSIVRFLNGGPAVPTFAPPRPHESGVGGGPTLVNNVETLAHLAMIARYGDGWFRSLGAPHAPGTMLVTVSGAVNRPGVYEIPLGTTIGHAMMIAGGPAERTRAVLCGGYFGRWLSAEVAWNVPLTHADLRHVESALGAGVLVAVPESACVLAETARVVRYLSEETAGQCGPCVFGLPELADALAELAFTGGRGRAIRNTSRLVGLVDGRGACRHPDGVAQLVASALDTFADDAFEHDQYGPCEGLRRRPLLPVPGDEDRDEVRK
jgi:NADH:ubiquinone oxidoreductase subunit F (NADH-binding)